MGCPAFGVSVAFLKQPALPGEASNTNFYLAVSKKRPKSPKLDIPFKRVLNYTISQVFT
jgi:hypothetical protein